MRVTNLLRYRVFLLFAAGFIGACGTATGRGTHTSDAASSELVALEKRFARTFVDGDVDSFDRFVSDDWVIIGAVGKVINKLEFVDVMKSGALTHSTMVSDQTRVRVYGNSATVTARTLTTGKYQGQAFTTTERSTDFFVRDQGEWKCVLTQLTAIAEK